MRPGKDLDNKPIISVSDGQILGRTKDVYLDQELTQLAGLFVGTEGMIRRKERFIPRDRIVLLGVDVILVKDSDVITTTNAFPEAEEWHRLTQLYGQEVRTPGGTRLATISDVILDETGAIAGLSLGRVFVSGPLAEKPMVPREVITDVFQSSDALIVDFPKLEAIFSGTEKAPEATEETPSPDTKEAGAEEDLPEKNAGDSDEAAEEDTSE